jgi:RHS repeat-associated protein
VHAYTPFNLPSRIDTPTGSTSYRYDSAHGRTVARQSNGDEVLTLGGLYEQRTQGGVRTHVFSVPGVGRTVAQVLWTEGSGGGVVSRRVLYLHDDRLGSTKTVTEAGGTSLVVERHKYGPFGERLQPGDLLRPLASAWGPVRRGFTGHEPDEALGLLNMRGRVYDPRLGRFPTPDPVAPGPQAGQAYNRYSYVLNDPLTYTDPSGFTPTLVTNGLGAGRCLVACSPRVRSWRPPAWKPEHLCRVPRCEAAQPPDFVPFDRGPW